MNKTIQHIAGVAAITIASLSLPGCNGGQQFRVNGEITQAQDSMLYFENLALEGIQVIDSAKLDASGAFEFAAPTTEAPEFYRLRIADQIITVSTDSTETVTIKGSFPAMASNYTVEGSDDCQRIKELTQRQMALQAQVQNIVQDPHLTGDALNDSILNVLNTYKRNVERDYVFPSPGSPSSYFALFQSIRIGQLEAKIFDPQRYAEDVKPFNAVATSWDVKYPEALRSKNLHNITIEAQKTQLILRNQNQGFEIEASKVSEANIIDLPLTDNKGTLRHLTDLKGKVVLLDFHVFGMDQSSQRILMLREIYNKYHDRGFEIYQVSLDENEHFWKTQTAALPWISVRDGDGRSQAYLTAAPGIPCSFIISRDNMVVMGPNAIKDLDSDIAKWL